MVLHEGINVLEKYSKLALQDNCDLIEDLSEFAPTSFDMREIVFVAKMPHRRDGVELQYSPSFQFILGLLQVDVEYHQQFKYGRLFE